MIHRPETTRKPSSAASALKTLQQMPVILHHPKVRAPRLAICFRATIPQVQENRITLVVISSGHGDAIHTYADPPCRLAVQEIRRRPRQRCANAPCRQKMMAASGFGTMPDITIRKVRRSTRTPFPVYPQSHQIRCHDDSHNNAPPAGDRVARQPAPDREIPCSTVIGRYNNGIGTR